MKAQKIAVSNKMFGSSHTTHYVILLINMHQNYHWAVAQTVISHTQ
jgi:hypothetical protein